MILVCFGWRRMTRESARCSLRVGSGDSPRLCAMGGRGPRGSVWRLMWGVGCGSSQDCLGGLGGVGMRCPVPRITCSKYVLPPTSYFLAGFSLISSIVSRFKPRKPTTRLIRESLPKCPSLFPSVNMSKLPVRDKDT